MTDVTALDILLEKIMLLLNRNDELSLAACMVKLIKRNHIMRLCKGMQFLRTFLKDSEQKRYEYEEVNAIVGDIRDVTYRIEDVMDRFLIQLISKKQRNDAVRQRLRRNSKTIVNFVHCFLFALFSMIERSAILLILGRKFFYILWFVSCLNLYFTSDVMTLVFFNVFFIMIPVLMIRKHLDCLCLNLNDVMEEVKLIEKTVLEIYDKSMYGISCSKTYEYSDLQYGATFTSISLPIVGSYDAWQIGKPSHGASSRHAISSTMGEETIVGFDHEASTMMELLTQESGKQLKVVSILGMPGLGKTTLARKVYDHPLIQYYFHSLAWTNVSPVYQKRDLLLAIFCSVAFACEKEMYQTSDEVLCEKLYKCLKGRRYLIVLDDIWTVDVWRELKKYFPDDKNGSRILCTSRHEGVAVALNAKFYHLRFRDENESWDLLRLKAFREDSCPPELMKIGKNIAKKCQGLPLAIVVIAGLLAKKDKTPEWWGHVAESVSSYIVSDREKYIDTLALSYNHLPHHLKPCFLYFGAFPEDYEIPIWRLIWLWVAEGFIQTYRKSLEEVAEEYLMDLIDRSLVLVSKKRSDGGIKACRVHDLLHDLCLRKAEEENFLQQISRYEHTSFSSSNPFTFKRRRMCIHDNLVDYTYLKHYESHIRSFLSFGHSSYKLPCMDVSFICQAFKLLRVLNLLSIKILFFPEEIKQLVHLRYLALYVEHDHEHFQPSISNLQNLETLIVEGPKGSLFLDDIWKMVKLRHVHTRRLIEIRFPVIFRKIKNRFSVNDGHPSILVNLQTISKLSILDDGDEFVLKWSPNLKKLKCQCYHFPQLEFLIHLQTLNLVYDGYKKFSHLGKFPTNLKSLTLSNFRLPWKAMSTLGSLPNLKVLKLSYKAFEGPRWDTSDGEFRGLKFLKLQGLDIEEWNVSSIHFANLDTLVLDDCERFEEIPSSLGDMCTLEMIQVRWCSYSAENSARQLQEQQRLMGNDGLQILIYSLNDN